MSRCITNPASLGTALADTADPARASHAVKIADNTIDSMLAAGQGALHGGGSGG